jgi:ribosomal-protein-alanine N-acetyltransferase
MQIDDLAQVHAIDVQSFSMPWPLSSYRYELLENPASLQWVAEACSPDGACQVVGMIVVWLILDEAHIATIAVQADHRGRGIGRVLLAQALQASIRKGAHMATLEVRAGNQVAQEFYRGFEFEVVNRRPRYYRDNNEDALIMTISGLDRAYAAWLEKKKLTAQDYGNS